MAKDEQMKFKVRTDLAVEVRELLQSDAGSDDEINGIKVTVNEDDERGITVTWVEVLDERGAKNMGKPIGNYITIESSAMKDNDVETEEEIAKILSHNLGQIKKLDKEAVILVVGLGNWNVTPDALGPKVVSKILVTRHLKDTLPESIDESVRAVSAVSPGVMGLTGIETGEIVKGIVDRVRPDLLIAIDALAARRTSRINATIQMSDTGIAPGAGVGNKRMELNEESLGIPVIAIGVPTVVDAATLVNDTMDMMLKEMVSQTQKGTDFYSMLADLDTEDKYGLIKELLNPYAGNMFVTPKDVDAVIERLSRIIANAINMALHPGIGQEDINRYLQS